MTPAVAANAHNPRYSGGRVDLERSSSAAYARLRGHPWLQLPFKSAMS